MAKKKLQLKSQTEEAAPDAAANPAPAIMPPSALSMKRPASYAGAVICGVLAVLALGALLAMQFIENSGYQGIIPR